VSSPLNLSFALANLGCSNADQAAALPRHRWYSVKEGFSPLLVEVALGDAACAAGDVVFDPFCGSGTVPVVAAAAGYLASAIEVNPFLRFVAATKLAQPRRDTLELLARRCLVGAKLNDPSFLEGFSTFSPRRGLSKWLFNRPILRAFQGGWNALRDASGDAADVTRLCLVGAAMDCSNAVRDGKCLRYRPERIEDGYRRKHFIEAFERRLESALVDTQLLPLEERARIVSGDSRKILRGRSVSPGFRLCVTSPPYLNSFDYSDVYRPELFLTGLIRNNAELMALRLQTLRSHVQAKWSVPRAEHAYGPLYDRALKDLGERKELLWDKRIPSMVSAYCEDMEIILRSLYRDAALNGVAWIVVSTSAYAGVEIPVDLIIADIAVRAGWSLREVGVLRHLRTSAHHWQLVAQGVAPRLRESVVILDRTTRRVKPRRLAARPGARTALL
jgi:hypothetical protein